MINLLVASSTVLFHQAIEYVFREYNEKIVVEHIDSGEQVLSRSLDAYFDLLIIDVNLDGLSGLDLFRKMNNKSLNSKVLVVSVPADENLLKEMIEMEIKGFLSLSADSTEYIQAVDSMIRKGRYVSTVFATKMVFRDTKFLYGNLQALLSKREYQVMLMLAKGSSLIEIAAELGLSDKTISTYKARILQKMNFENISQLIKYLINIKII